MSFNTNTHTYTKNNDAKTHEMSSIIAQSIKQQQATLCLYDSMSTEKRLFTPIESGKVGIYVCGMTVYDYCHIGHARVMVAFDMIARWLRHLGFDVNYVRNITDIDDKIIARAQDNNEGINALTERFTAAMHEDAAALGCVRPDLEPKATDYIDDMLSMIGTLEAKKHAYAANNGDVYYAVDTFADYGKLSKRKLDELQAGSRVEVESDKKNPFDFVLWKAAKPDEPQWSSNWGNGRPGWHIECSTMSTKCLGNSFDIHGGGHDLQFPHHENEIAQSEAATGCTYAHHWMHVGFINVDGEKMSKSLGNFFTIRDVMEKYHPETIRFFILSSHYRSQVNFSDSALDDAHTGLTRIYQALKAADALFMQSGFMQSGQDTVIDESMFTHFKQTKACAEQNQYTADFIAAMNDDFNTPLAISVLFGLARQLNKCAREFDIDSSATKDKSSDQLSTILALTKQLRGLAATLNIGQLDATQFLQAQVGRVDDDQLSEAAIEQLIQDRLSARSKKDFARADEIRDQLQNSGIELEDSKQGTTWRRL